MKRKVSEWFEEVWVMVTMWWQLGLVICLLDGFLAYIKVGTLAVFITTTCQTLLVMFFIVPIALGTVIFFMKAK